VSNVTPIQIPPDPRSVAADGPPGKREATMPAGNDATSSPIVAGPAPVASAIAGATGTITL
jgi:hypothetical protein